jgi:hypothetical protein
MLERKRRSVLDQLLNGGMKAGRGTCVEETAVLLQILNQKGKVRVAGGMTAGLGL